MNRPDLVDRAYLPPAPDALSVHYLDDELLVAVKPSGLLSVPGRGAEKHASALTYLQKSYGDVRVVHRLDMDTSGLIIFARTAHAQTALSHQFQARHVEKTYDALIEGVPDAPNGYVDLPIGRRWADRPKRRIDPESGQPAETRWKVLSRSPAHTRIKLEPVTGRTHQLRLHMAAIGHPILGDRLYGDGESWPRLCLHASGLVLTHPATEEHLQFECPADFG